MHSKSLVPGGWYWKMAEPVRERSLLGHRGHALGQGKAEEEGFSVGLRDRYEGKQPEASGKVQTEHGRRIGQPREERGEGQQERQKRKGQERGPGEEEEPRGQEYKE